MQRRIFVLSSPLFLAGCLTGPDKAIATVASDAKLIANGLAGALSQLGSLGIPGLTPAIVAQVGTAIAGITSVADALAGVSTQAEAQPLVAKIETYLNAVVGALAMLPLPPAIALPLQAATILLPIIEALVGMVFRAPPQAAGAARRAAPPLTPDEARLILAGSAALR